MSAMRAPVSLEAVRQRRADHRTEADYLRMELTARKSEALRLVAASQPYLNRLELVAHEVGPTAMATVMGLSSLIARHGRQWDDGGDAA